MHYYDLFASPNEWKTKFIFENNIAPTGSSIFTTTLLSCIWSASYRDQNLITFNALNWTSFSYNPLDANTIATEIANIFVKESMPVDIIPGKYSSLPITSTDDKGNNISRSLWLVSDNKSVQVSSQITYSTINLQGIPSSEAIIEIVTDSSRVISACHRSVLTYIKV